MWQPSLKLVHQWVFCFVALLVLHTIVRLQLEGVEEKSTRYAVRLGGSSRIIRATGQIIKSRGIRKSVA